MNRQAFLEPNGTYLLSFYCLIFFDKSLGKQEAVYKSYHAYKVREGFQRLPSLSLQQDLFFIKASLD